MPGSYEVFHERMALAIMGDGPVPVRSQAARDAVWVLECALRSSREGRVVAPG